jgi:hypothetical protein
MPRYREGWSSGPLEPTDDETSYPASTPLQGKDIASTGHRTRDMQGPIRRQSGVGGGSDMFMGEVRNLDKYQEQGGLNFQRWFQVLTFRVDRRDSAGNLQQSVSVRLRGQRIVGNVKEGDRVEVKGRPGRDGVVRVTSFRNLTTQSIVTGRGLLMFPEGGLGGRRPGGPSQHGAARISQLVVLIGAVVFTASVTLLPSYVNNGTGGKSLLQATSGDLASPLYPKDFRILIALVAIASVTTVMGMYTYRRLFMIGAAAASIGLIGYTLHIPQIGLAPGFGPYGPAYWLSLAAAVAMAFGAGTAATARSY